MPKAAIAFCDLDKKPSIHDELHFFIGCAWHYAACLDDAPRQVAPRQQNAKGRIADSDPAGGANAIARILAVDPKANCDGPCQS
jgi:hypothetical protein